MGIGRSGRLKKNKLFFCPYSPTGKMIGASEVAMKKSFIYLLIFAFLSLTVNVFVVFYCIFQKNRTPSSETIVKSEDGVYYLKSNPELFELIMPDGCIIFSRKNAFSVSAVYRRKSFFWSDNRDNIYMSYNGIAAMDFDRDFVFDFFYEKGKYFIVCDGKRIEVNKPDFKAMRTGDKNNRKYFWNGFAWLLQSDIRK